MAHRKWAIFYVHGETLLATGSIQRKEGWPVDDAIPNGYEVPSHLCDPNLGFYMWFER